MRWLLLTLLLGCAKRGEPDVPEAEPPPVPAQAPDARWVGTWTSPSCADRTYERRFTLLADHVVQGEERISPCPAGATCVWEGISRWTGTWSADDSLHFVVGEPPVGRGAASLAMDFTWTNGPVEARGDTVCPYTRIQPPVAETPGLDIKVTAPDEAEAK